MRRNLALMLELEGYRVISAENGRIGVDLALQHRPDLVLCDVMMPELDGYGVVQMLRAHPETMSLPFVFLTAKGERIDVRIGMNFGADDYLTKPVMRDELLAAIQMRLERAAQLRQSATATGGAFRPDFSSPVPLQNALGITPREAETLLWVAQGKSNADIAVILGLSEKTVKQHLGSVFQKIGVEGRNAATVRALEVLANPTAPS